MRNGAAFWNEHDTKVFCEMCKEEVDAGNRVDGYLSAEGYRNLQLKFNATTQRGYVKEHFKYRWNSLKYQYTRFRNGRPDNLSLLDEMFGEGKSLAIPVEDLGEDTEEAARVTIVGSDEDDELTLTAMKKANLAKRKVSCPPMVNVLAKEDKNPLLLEYKKSNQEHAGLRNGLPDNLSLLDKLFGKKTHVGKSLAIPGEDLGEDKQEAAPVSIDGSDTDVELAKSAMKKAKLSIPGKDLAEDKQDAARVSIDGLDKDAELAQSAMEKAKSTKHEVSSPMNNLENAKFTDGPTDNLSLVDKSPAIPGEDFGEDREEATRVNINGSDKDAELTQSAMKKAKFSIPGEDLAEDKEVATPVNIDGLGKDAELTPSAMEKLKSAKRKVSSMVDVLMKEPVPQKYKKTCDALSVSAEVSSGDSNMVPTIREAVGLIRECGVSEGTALFYTATKTVAMNPEYRELFSLIQTREGRLDWLQRAHDDTAKRVHL